MPTRQTVSAFSPKLFAAWEKAAQPGGLEVNCGKGEQGRKKAVQLRYRMYQLRTAMGKDQHPFHDTAMRITLRITATAQGHLLIGTFADENLEDLLDSAGVAEPAPPPLPEDLLNG